jgi:hypothetical protein
MILHLMWPLLAAQNPRRAVLLFVVAVLTAAVLFSCDGPNPFPPSG